MEQWNVFHILVRWKRSREGAHKLRLIEGEIIKALQYFCRKLLHWQIPDRQEPWAMSLAECKISGFLSLKDMLLFYFIVLANFQARLFISTLDLTKRDYWLLVLHLHHTSHPVYTPHFFLFSSLSCPSMVKGNSTPWAPLFFCFEHSKKPRTGASTKPGATVWLELIVSCHLLFLNFQW
jgi:hypothetical protein